MLRSALGSRRAGHVQGRADREDPVLSKAEKVRHREPRARLLYRDASRFAAGGVMFKDVLTGRIKS
jgi:hypothetical protein